MKRNTKKKTILNQLNELESLPTEELKARWKILNGQDPPRFNRQFLIKRLAYRIQEIAYGGLDAHTKTRMEQLLDNEGFNELGIKVKKAVRKTKRNTIIPGTVLIREWQGKSHEVIASEDNCFEYHGMPYRSLSAVARAITGTRWNGPAFFGLRGKDIKIKESQHGRE